MLLLLLSMEGALKLRWRRAVLERHLKFAESWQWRAYNIPF